MILAALSDSNRTTIGWGALAAAIGMMAGLVSVDVVGLHSRSDATTPAFAGNLLAHFGAVLTAYVAGRLIPDNPRDPNAQTRSTDT